MCKNTMRQCLVAHDINQEVWFLDLGDRIFTDSQIGLLLIDDLRNIQVVNSQTGILKQEFRLPLAIDKTAISSKRVSGIDITEKNICYYITRDSKIVIWKIDGNTPHKQKGFREDFHYQDACGFGNNFIVQIDRKNNFMIIDENGDHFAVPSRYAALACVKEKSMRCRSLQIV